MASALRAGVHIHGREHVCTVHRALQNAKTAGRLSGPFTSHTLGAPPCHGVHRPAISDGCADPTDPVLVGLIRHVEY